MVLAVEPCTVEATGKQGWVMCQRAQTFLLQPKHAQVWQIMHAYMQCAEAAGAGSGAAAGADGTLSFLMRLGFLRVGQDYPVDGLSVEQQKVLTPCRQSPASCLLSYVPSPAHPCDRQRH